MNDKLNSLMGKTVARAELITTVAHGVQGMEVLTVVFTDGSTLTVCEGEPDWHINGIAVEVTL